MDDELPSWDSKTQSIEEHPKIDYEILFYRAEAPQLRQGFVTEEVVINHVVYDDGNLAHLFFAITVLLLVTLGIVNYLKDRISDLKMVRIKHREYVNAIAKSK